MSGSRRRLLLAFVAGLLATVGPAEAQFRPQSKDSRKFRVSTTFVTIIVPASAFDRRTGIAVVTVPRAVMGSVYSNRPWTLRVRAESLEARSSAGLESKPYSDLAIRGGNDAGFRPLSVTPTSLVTGGKTAGWQPIAIDLQLTARLTDASSAYAFRLQFDLD